MTSNISHLKCHCHFQGGSRLELLRALKSVKWTSSMSAAFDISAQHGLKDSVCLCHQSLSTVMMSFSCSSRMISVHSWAKMADCKLTEQMPLWWMGMLTDSSVQVFQTPISKTAHSKLFWCTDSTIKRNVFHLRYTFPDLLWQKLEID